MIWQFYFLLQDRGMVVEKATDVGMHMLILLLKIIKEKEKTDPFRQKLNRVNAHVF